MTELAKIQYHELLAEAQTDIEETGWFGAAAVGMTKRISDMVDAGQRIHLVIDKNQVPPSSSSALTLPAPRSVIALSTVVEIIELNGRAWLFKNKAAPEVVFIKFDNGVIFNGPIVEVRTAVAAYVQHKIAEDSGTMIVDASPELGTFLRELMHKHPPKITLTLTLTHTFPWSWQ
jgi:hypothetical protein